MPKLTEQRFNPLPHAAVQFAFVRHVPPRDQQQVVLFSQQLGQLRPVLAQIRQHQAPINGLCQFRSRAPVIDIASRQDRINNAAIQIAQGVQFETKEPASTGFTKVGPLITQQAHPPVTNGFTDGDRLGIQQVESASAEQSSRDQQPTDDRAETMQALKPLLVGAKFRESRSKIIGDKVIGLFERSDAEKTLHQANGDNFRIGKGWRGIGRAAPVGQPGVGFKEVINEAVDVSHLIYNGRQMGRPPGVEMCFATSFYTPSELWRPNLSTQYSGLLM